MIIFNNVYAGAIFGKIAGTFTSDSKDPALLKTLNKIYNVYENRKDIMEAENEVEATWENICKRLGVDYCLDDPDMENIICLYESMCSDFCYYMYFCTLMLVKEKYPDIQIQGIFTKAYEDFKDE